MENFERSLTEYNEGQEENSNSHITYFDGKTGTGKGQVSGWAKEHGMASGNLKIFEAHGTQPAHLKEIFQFMFPNGFLMNEDCKEILDSVLEQFDRGAYEDGDVGKQDIKDLYQLLEDGKPPDRVEKLEELLESNPARSLKRRLQEVREKQQEIKNRLDQLREYGLRNNDLPDTFQRSYADGLNQRFDVDVFVPISKDMPTAEVPDFFTPFAIPINAYAQYEQLEDGLRIVLDKKFQEYNRIYQKLMDESTTYEDLKNIGDLEDVDFKTESSFKTADGEKTFTVTDMEIEGQQLEEFKRRFNKMFADHGIVCSPDFEHRLRPKLKEAILGDDQDIVALYTGFLKNDAQRKFVITYFLEMYEEIIQNGLEPGESKNLDRKFVVSGIEAQEWVRESRGNSRSQVQDKVVVNQLDRMMDNCRHFNTDFWFDVKPDKAHDIILRKASDRFATSMNEEDVEELSWDSELKTKYEDAINHIPYNSLDDQFPEFGYGFVYLEGTNSVPEWSLRNRKQYGHRLPTPRMCVQDPVERFSMNDWSFFLQFDRWDSMRFQEYQDQLFIEDWERAAEPYIKKKEKQKRQKEKEEQEREEEMKQLRKQAAISKLESKVEKKGEVPGEWKEMVQEIHAEMVENEVIPEDFSKRKIYEYTQERRQELKEEFETRRPDDIGYKQIARELVQDKEFVFGGNSKGDKQFRAKEYILDEYSEFGEDGAEEVGNDSADKAVSWLQTEGVLTPSLQADILREDFEQEISERFPFAEFDSVEEDDEEVREEDQGSSSESNTQDTVQKDDVDEEPNDEDQDNSGYRKVKITSPVPEFTGTDLETYGPFEEGEVVEVPVENAEILENRGNAVQLETEEN